MKPKEDIQNRNGRAWKKLCAAIDRLAEEGAEEFHLYNELGVLYYKHIYTLPESISKLKKVKKINLYGSNLRRIPPEIGEMSSLETFLPYTSYDLHWFPYEIVNCKNLIDSTISTRALYGNSKKTLGFPNLNDFPIEYYNGIKTCSICKKNIENQSFDQVWTSLGIGTDVVPLLVNSCSDKCTRQLPRPPEGYIQHPHKGGMGPAEIQQNPMFGVKHKRRSKLYKILRFIFKK